MNAIDVVKAYILAKAMTLYYSCLVLFAFFVNFLKNPFKDPWAQKLRLEPPSCLSDPKYGVHKYMIFNNTKLHYVESGDPSKPLMIFLHGFPEFWYSWRYQIVEFNKDYWCVAVDMRGYGDSEKPEEQSSYKIEPIVDDVRDIVRKLGREKCILVAHDWGSLIASKFRDTYPEALEAIVVVGGTSYECGLKEIFTNPEQFKKSWYIFLFQAPWIPEKMVQMNDLEIFEKSMLVNGKDTVTKQDIECYKYWFGKPQALTAPINYYRANFSYVLREKPRCDLKIPFLLVNGANDNYLSRGLLDKMKDNYSYIETMLIENCGHFVQQEEPQRLNKIVREFLNKHKV